MLVYKDYEKSHVRANTIVIVIYRCEVFRAMFSTPTTSDENAPLILSDVKPIVFMAVLEFIYTNSCNLTADIVCSCVALLCMI